MIAMVVSSTTKSALRNSSNKEPISDAMIDTMSHFAGQSIEKLCVFPWK